MLLRNVFVFPSLLILYELKRKLILYWLYLSAIILTYIKLFSFVCKERSCGYVSSLLWSWLSVWLLIYFPSGEK